MADFLVLEEDGTSNILLENADSFLLEESSPQERSVSFGATAAWSAVQAAPPVVPSRYMVGTITVPSSTGSMAITGLGGTPAAIIFFGTNWLTEDTAITSAASALFRGMVAPKYDDPGTLVQGFLSNAPPGDAYSTGVGAAIACLNSSGGTGPRYSAAVTSLDGDGFTLDWTFVTAGGYKVVYVAVMDTANVGGYSGTSATISLGFKAGAAMLHGGGAGPTASAGFYDSSWYGSASYPGTFGPNWLAAGLACQTYPTERHQFNVGLYSFGADTVITQSSRFGGPFLVTADITAIPTGTGLEDYEMFMGTANGGTVVVWDDEENTTGITTPAVSEDGTVTVSGLPFAPSLLIGYGISDHATSQSSGYDPGAVGMFVVTPEFQWAALTDGYNSRGAFQSFQRGFVDVVNGTSVHAGTVELTDDGFVMTTVEDDVTSWPVVWHAFGGLQPVSVWIPRIYRRNPGW